MRHSVAAFAAMTLAVPIAGQSVTSSLPDRLGSLSRVGEPGSTVKASYVELPGASGAPSADVFVRSLHRTAAEDMAVSEGPLRQIAGVTEPGEMLAPTARCPDVLARVDRGRVAGRDTVTGSLFALRGDDNIKLRVTAPAARGPAFIRAILEEFRTRALGC